MTRKHGHKIRAMQTTRESLLMSLRRTGATDAWRRFCNLYATSIIRYGMKLGLSESDARDVLQETLIILMRQLPSFDYDPARRFRNYLLTIVHRQALALFRKRNRRPEVPLDETSAQAEIARCPKHDDDAAAQTRWHEALFDDAWSRLQKSGKLQLRTIAIFTEYAIEGHEAETVRKKHDVDANTVHQIRNRVIKMLKDEVRLLIAEMDPEEIAALGDAL